ncbi:histone-like nucleoid-structuring protein, MvaT/MvaU family [Halomonas sp. KO116]|uniref:histone-like nucleoid-structuring protein, MvaT/MvaU family n=1 Tax=Halomonas sp. KO116 TaxID=1504981 RepID=UPI0004E3DF60|nr:histone-like nucleoid-structuring protein, MvaT/MvaU family [Halomonas sp. KO116]AJY53203.1 histone family protein nucleoid-structuring protein H-NS [Halomonas sp. KO116]
MSVLKTYLDKENELKNLQAELEAMKDDAGLKHEMELKQRIEALMTEFDKTNRDVINLLDPEHFSTNASGKTGTGVRKKRALKVYKNPETGEVIETRGGNHKGIRAWKDQYGQETVDSWVIAEHT